MKPPGEYTGKQQKPEQARGGASSRAPSAPTPSRRGAASGLRRREKSPNPREPLDVNARQRSEEEMRRFHRRHELLSTTAERLLVSEDPQALVEELCRRVMEYLDCQVFFNFLVDEPSGRLRLNSFAGIPAEEARRIEWLDHGAAVYGLAAVEGKPIVSEDILGKIDPKTELVKSYGVQAYACHPLLTAGGRVLGSLSFGTRVRRHFSAEDLSLMKAVTSQVATAVGRSRLRDELERRVRERTASLEGAIALAQAEHRQFQATLDQLPAYLLLLSPDYHVPFANRFFEERYGKAQGRRCYEYLFQRTEPCENCQTYEALKTNAPHRWEWTAPDGRVYDIHDFPFRGADGLPLIMEVGLDITEHKRDEKHLAERTAEVQRLADQLRALAVELSQAEQRERKRLSKVLHDHIQQLLVAARMQLEWMKSDGSPLRLQGTAQAVDSILREALEASRSLTVELSPPVLHQAGLIGGLNWLAAQMREKNQFTVNLRSDNRAEPDTEETRLLLFECARELLFNVMKHAGVAEAQVALLRAGERIRMIISDAGAGFDPDSLKKRRSDDVSFGLFSIQQRLAHLGGEMAIQTAPGQGTSVTLTIPVGELKQRPETAENVPPEERGAARMSVREKAASYRVLIVDDHKIMREGLVGLLRFEPDIEIVGQATDGSQAVELAARLQPDVIIMDVNLGEMSGVEATKAILAGNPRIRVIGLSMYTDADVAMAMRDAGAVAYLTKGGPSEDLISAIRACCR